MLIVYLTGAWLGGIFLGSLLGQFVDAATLLPLLWAANSLPLSIVFLWRRERRIRASALCALFLLLGTIRYVWSSHYLDPHHIASYNECGSVTLEGAVCREPDTRDRYVNLVVSVDWLETSGDRSDAHGTVLVKAGRYPVYRFGDVIEVRGALETPPEFEDFSYKEYLAHQGIHSMVRWPSITLLSRGSGKSPRSRLCSFKTRLLTVLGRALPEPESSLLAGILLGMDRRLPDRVSEAFRTTGLLHIVVISGFNITMVAGWVGRASRRLFGARSATWVALAGIGLYTLLVGADPPVVRAAIMGALTLLAYHVGRPAAALPSLATAVLVMTALEPHQIWSVSFQLSIMSTLGLIVLVPRLELAAEACISRWVGTERAARVLALVGDTLVVTLAAQITTLPLLMHYFRQVSLISILTNLLALPVQPAIMVAGTIALLLGVIWFPLGQICSWAVWLPLTYTIRVAETLARVPWAAVPLSSLDALWISLYYALLAALVLRWRPRSGLERGVTRVRSISPATRRLLAGFALLAILAWLAALSLPDGRLHVIFLDVGQGDAILIRTPDGKTVLLDGGPSPAVLMSELGRRLPFWDRGVDLLILSHPDDDHITGLLPVLERYDVRQVMEPGWEVRTPIYAEWQRIIAERGVARTFPPTETQIDLGQGVRLDVLHPGDRWIRGTDSDTNNNSLVLRLTMGQVVFLLTGDIEAPAEGRLLLDGSDLSCAVLKVPHHGAGTSLSRPFLRATHPQLGIISVGKDNDFGHPAQATLEKLMAERVSVLRTDHVGCIEVATDGRTYSVRTTRTKDD